MVKRVVSRFYVETFFSRGTENSSVLCFIKNLEAKKFMEKREGESMKSFRRSFCMGTF